MRETDPNITANGPVLADARWTPEQGAAASRLIRRMCPDADDLLAALGLEAS